MAKIKKQRVQNKDERCGRLASRGENNVAVLCVFFGGSLSYVREK